MKERWRSAKRKLEEVDVLHVLNVQDKQTKVHLNALQGNHDPRVLLGTTPIVPALTAPAATQKSPRQLRVPRVMPMLALP